MSDWILSIKLNAVFKRRFHITAESESFYLPPPRRGCCTPAMGLLRIKGEDKWDKRQSCVFISVNNPDPCSEKHYVSK